MYVIQTHSRRRLKQRVWQHFVMAMCNQLIRADLSVFASPLFGLGPQCLHRTGQHRYGSYIGTFSKQARTSSHGGGRLALVLTGGRSRSVDTSLKGMGQVSESSAGQDEARASPVAEKDLLVVGPGVLGRLIAQHWLQEFEGSKVVGQTRTSIHHEELRSLGILPVVKDDQATDKYPYVVFCAPPYGNEDYAAEVRAAAQRWNGEGSLLFTSASSVFDVSDNGPCDEGVAPVVAKGVSPRTDRLLYAEDEVLKVGGNVVRLAGLYTGDRGAHIYWLKVGTVDARPDHVINLIHYEDAASLCVAALKARTSKQVFVGCDSSPISRQEIMEAARKSGKFEGEFKGFTTASGPLGKRMTNNVTRESLNWKPRYSSFAKFFEDF